MLKAVVLGQGVFKGDYGNFLLGGAFLYKIQQDGGPGYTAAINTQVSSADFDGVVKN